MSRKKLTLSIQERLTKRAKKIAKKRGTSVSRLVETFFTALKEEEKQHDTEQPAEQDLSESGGEEQLSKWARRWRGAFAEEGETYPDDPSWEEDLLREELEKKHAPQ